MSRYLAAALGAVFLALAVAPALAAGDLAGRPEVLPDLVLGTDDLGFEISQRDYNLETGKAYQLKIISTGKQEYAIIAPEFFDVIWLRKVEAGDMEIKANRLSELEFEEEAEAEIFFVPIRPGSYAMRARGLEERGVVVTFTIK